MRANHFDYPAALSFTRAYVLIVTTYQGSQKFQSSLKTYFPGDIGLIYHTKKLCLAMEITLGSGKGKGWTLADSISTGASDFFSLE